MQKNYLNKLEANRGTEAQNKIKLLFPFFQRKVLSSATFHSHHHLHVMPPEFGGKWGTECLDTSAYPAVCWIQREISYSKINFYKKHFFKEVLIGNKHEQREF